MGKKGYSWNPRTCICENSKYLKSIAGYCINKNDKYDSNKCYEHCFSKLS